ncbi:MAG: hypothetical protein LIO96_02215 [Lachnospiraceae bacterium]|nr:hypothetical protein [Lachnospiraceae bacterium]
MGDLGVTTEMDFLKEADRTATRILTEHRGQLEKVSRELAERSSLTGEEVEELLK